MDANVSEPNSTSIENWVGKKLSNLISPHDIWVHNCLPLHLIQQLADLDSRKRITVWNELHATVTYGSS